MDIKSRLKNLLSKENDLYSAPNVDPDEATTGISGFMEHEDIREFANDPTPDNEVISGIESIYFRDIHEFDSSEYELNKLPGSLCKESLDNYRNILRRQQQAVSRELSKKILENQGAYVRELTRVMDLQKNLQATTGICKQGRTNLSQALNEMACGGLQILAKNRRMVLLQGILKSLRFIKTLQETDVRLKELLEENNFASAIQICLEYGKAAVSFNQYTCIRELSNNLKEILEHIKERLDIALSNLCLIFSQDEYIQILKAYKLLGITHIDKMLMHFVNTVNKVAIQTIYDVLAEVGIRTSDTNFSSLCNAIPFEEFISCLVKLCKKFWTIMYSYHEMVKWHKNGDNLKQTMAGDEEEIAFAFNTEMTQGKLEQGMGRIWQDIQQKVEGYVLSSDFSYFKYDGLIVVLDIVNQLISVGEEFCSKKSKVLQDSIRTQTVNYFTAYHKSNMDQLKTFLENEAWELCPVRENFSFLDLKEFYFMKSQVSLNKGSNLSILSVSSGKGYFDNETYNKLKSPFDLMGGSNGDTDKVYHEEVFQYYGDDDDNDDDVPDELKRDYIDEKTGEEQLERPTKAKRQRNVMIAENTPIVTNTTLDILRSFGKYMQMITVLKPIAFEVVTYMTQLFDYYLFSVYTFFSMRSSQADSKMDMKLKNCLSRIYSSIIFKDGFESEGSLNVVAPTLSTMVDLQNPLSLYGFTHKLIGVESLVFLSKQLRMMYQDLDSWIPQNKQAFLGQFYEQTVDIVKEIRTPVFKTITDVAIEYDKILQMMSSVKWDVKEIMSEHSPYINSLVYAYQHLDRVIHSFANSVPLPQDSLLEFWRNVVMKTNWIFVEGFSSAKKCSNQGRALMLLDFENFAMKIEDITKLKPVPDREYVVNYINAFYLCESVLESWLKEHQEYTPKQLSNLITCGTGSHIGKKMKEKFLGLLNEIESNNIIAK